MKRFQKNSLNRAVLFLGEAGIFEASPHKFTAHGLIVFLPDKHTKTKRSELRRSFP